MTPTLSHPWTYLRRRNDLDEQRQQKEDEQVETQQPRGHWGS